MSTRTRTRTKPIFVFGKSNFLLFAVKHFRLHLKTTLGLHLDTDFGPGSEKRQNIEENKSIFDFRQYFIVYKRKTKAISGVKIGDSLNQFNTYKKSSSYRWILQRWKIWKIVWGRREREGRERKWDEEVCLAAVGLRSSQCGSSWLSF